MEPLLALVCTLEAVNSTLASVIVDVVNNEYPTNAYVFCAGCLNDVAAQQMLSPKVFISELDLNITNVDLDLTKVTGNDIIVVVTATDEEAHEFMQEIDISTQSRFLVLWHQGKNFSGLFQTCWSRNFVRVVAAVIQRGYVPLYSFVPFNEEACVDTRPVLVGEWPRSTSGLFPSGDLNDLQGCLINATAIHYPPYLLLQERMPNMTEEMDGQWAPVLQYMAQKLNAQLHLIPRPNMSFPDQHNITDAFFFGKFASTPSRSQTMDMPAMARADCYSICVPRFETPRSPLSKLLKPFDTKAWWALYVAFVANLFTIYVLFSGTEPIARVALNLIAKLAGGSGCEIKTAGAKDMVVGIIWSLSCLVLMTLYQGREHSFRSTLKRLDWINTVDDLARYGLPVKGDPIMVETVKDIYPKINLAAFEAEYGIFEEPVNALAGYIADKAECSILNERRGFRSDGRHPMALLDGCAFIVHERLFLLPKHSPLTERVAEVHLRLTESGILHHIMDVDPLPEAVSIPLRTLTMNDVEPVFTLLVNGLIIAFAVFVGEVAWVRIASLLLYSGTGRQSSRRPKYELES